MSKIVQQHIPCPSCTSSDGYCIYDDGHGYCFSCKHLYWPNKSKGFEEEMYTYEYLPHRGLLRGTLEKYDIRTKIDKDGKPIAVGFRYPNESLLVRDLDDKSFRWDGGSNPGLFGRDVFNSGSNETVTITEGAYDAASIYQVTGTPVVSVRSSSSAVSDIVHDRSWLNSFGKIILAFDGDTAGREATSAVAKLFEYNKVLVVNFDKRKDANDYLQAGESDELRTIWKNAKRYLPETVKSSFAEFKKILESTPTEGIRYPFSGLNDKTFGIRRGETVLLTAQEGIGKTEICHAILHQLLEKTDDNVGAFFLEEPEGHLLRAMAGLHLKMPTHLPTCPATQDEVFEALQKLCRRDDRLYVYKGFGSDDPDTIVDTVRFLVVARNVVHVCLDHISMVVSGLTTEDERRKLDYLCTKLEMLVKELNFSLLLVSHVNDLGQTRGSRYIGKVADIRIDATRDLLAEDETLRNTTFLTVSKNRYCGKTGPAGAYIFNQSTRQYVEADNDNYPAEASIKTAA